MLEFKLFELRENAMADSNRKAGKKKIIVFATGWAQEILYQFLAGARDALEEISADLYLFLCHPTFSDQDGQFRGEVNIFQLPVVEDFDGALVFGNGLDFREIIADINERCKKAGIPVVYTGNDKQDGYFVGSDNYVGARKLCDHIMEEHGAKMIFFLAGSRENMDSNIRLQALKDAVAAHGLELAEEDICYTNWESYKGSEFVRGKIKQGEMPDAVVCANDTIAMILSSHLNDMGISVPGQVIVTGFDNDPYAQIYDPAISSVDQRFDLIGQMSARTLIQAFRGEKPEKVQRIPCEFVPSESCGCMSAKDFGAIRKSLGKNKFMDNTLTAVFDQNLSLMERRIMEGKCYKDLRESFARIQRIFADYHGDSFHVVLDPLFEQSVQNQDRQLRRTGYAPIMDAVFSVCNGNVISNPEFETRKLIPQEDPREENHQYIFLPIHELGANMGYVIFCNNLEMVKEDQFIRKYMERLNIILGKYLRDLRVGVLHSRLLELTETDALTRVKNRTAYKVREDKINNRIRTEANLEFGVAIFDVNNLKKINDRLGHEAGDEYIIHSCRLICRVFKKSAVYRIGGDEFAVVLEGDDYRNREELLNAMQDAMKELRESDIPEQQKVSIASGAVIFDRTTDREYADVFKRADAVMYENKAVMKKML